MEGKNYNIKSKGHFYSRCDLTGILAHPSKIKKITRGTKNSAFWPPESSQKGILTLKVTPGPSGFFRTSRRPSWASTIFFAIGRPSPVPFSLVVSERNYNLPVFNNIYLNMGSWNRFSLRKGSLAPHTIQKRESPGLLDPHWVHLRGTPREVPHFLQYFDCFGFSSPQWIHFIWFQNNIAPFWLSTRIIKNIKLILDNSYCLCNIRFKYLIYAKFGGYLLIWKKI